MKQSEILPRLCIMRTILERKRKENTRRRKNESNATVKKEEGWITHRWCI